MRDEVGKEALDEVLGVLRVLPSPPSKGVQGPPVKGAQASQGFRAAGRRVQRVASKRAGSDGAGLSSESMRQYENSFLGKTL